MLTKVSMLIFSSNIVCVFIERMAGIEAFLILTVAALHLAVVARRVGPDQLVTDAQLGCRDFK